MPKKLVDISKTENFEKLLKEKVIIQDATSITFVCESCKKQTVVKSFYNWRRRSNVFVCGKCKIKNTKIKKYGSIENANIARQKAMEENNLKKYGVKNVFQLQSVKDKSIETSLEKYGEIYPQRSSVVKQRQKDTWEKTLGAANPFVSKKCREKAKLTNLEKYGVDCILKLQEVKDASRDAYAERSDEIIAKRKQTCLEKYGAECPMKTDESIAKMLKTKDLNNSWSGRKKYLYKNEYYDSTWELIFVFYCEENNIYVSRNTSFFFNYVSGRKTHRYFPDFVADDGHYIEVKGGHLLGKNPFDKKDQRSIAKLQCMIDNDVEILSDDFFNRLVLKYKKGFFKQFLVKN